MGRAAPPWPFGGGNSDRVESAFAIGLMLDLSDEGSVKSLFCWGVPPSIASRSAF